ncbi:GatB/YqeY domain-containing protein [Bacillaceae bacterium SIJ1]|uniref:GatB/YqeY domain-containing protein n=1 Tax=Litoribacterium kuwaitense TaxID=1398745 RepID=UPI0013EA007F|nr:GatB/YqeY domain-containing protein [Litoribacterium kuwaitense]NGP43516.1 GatB/YqeY domain-containing protein [Litoribacterium kuwaitense]
MELLEQLNQHMKEAMKRRDKDTLAVIRMLKASYQNEAIKLGKAVLSEEEALEVLSREAKQRKDSLREFDAAGRSDLAEQTARELDIVQRYMPEQLSEQQLRELIQNIVQEVNASSSADMGKVMGAVMPKVKGKADGNAVRAIVQEELQ